MLCFPHLIPTHRIIPFHNRQKPPTQFPIGSLIRCSPFTVGNVRWLIVTRLGLSPSLPHLWGTITNPHTWGLRLFVDRQRLNGWPVFFVPMGIGLLNGDYRFARFHTLPRNEFGSGGFWLRYSFTTIPTNARIASVTIRRAMVSFVNFSIFHLILSFARSSPVAHPRRLISASGVAHKIEAATLIVIAVPAPIITHKSFFAFVIS